MSPLTVPGHPFQYAWHVPDMEQAIDYWAKVVGVGPFFINEVDSATMEGFQYRGGDGVLRMRVAWAQSKEGQIELIEVNSSEPNVYHDLIAPDKTAFHHIGIWSDDYFKDKSALSAQFDMAFTPRSPTTAREETASKQNCDAPPVKNKKKNRKG